MLPYGDTLWCFLDRSSAIAAAYPKASSFAKEIVSVADKIGIDPAWLANVINFESGFSTSIQNRYTKATGLIQFIPSTAARLNTSVDELKNMTPQQQMVYVEKYFQPFTGRLKSQEDVYMAVFYPVAIGKPDYTFKLSVQAVNPGIKTPRDYAAKANRNAKLTSLNNENTQPEKVNTSISTKRKKQKDNTILYMSLGSILLIAGISYFAFKNNKRKQILES